MSSLGFDGTAGTARAISISISISIARAVAALVLAVAVAVVSLALGSVPTARAQSKVVPKVEAEPLDGLRDGQRLRVHAEVDPAIELFEIRARVCRPGVAITDTWAYSADDDNCPMVPLSPSAEPEGVATLGRGQHRGDLELQVGVGTVGWRDFDGNDVVLTCGRESPCQLVVQLQVTDDTLFWSAPMSYSSSQQLDPPVPPTTRPRPDEDGQVLPPHLTVPVANGGVADGLAARQQPNQQAAPPLGQGAGEHEATGAPAMASTSDGSFQRGGTAVVAIAVASIAVAAGVIAWRRFRSSARVA